MQTQPASAEVKAPTALAFEGFCLAGPHGPLRRDGEVIALPKKPLALLWVLANRSAEVVTKDELLAAVWPRVIVTDGAVAATLRDLRRALGDDAQAPRFILTARGIGYRFIAKMTTTASSVAVPASRATLPAVPSLARANMQAAAMLLVGRDAELAEMQSACAAALAGRRQVVFITGHAGMGKSRLIERLVSSLQTLDAVPSETWRIGFGQCIEHYGEGESYLPVLEAISRCCRLPDGASLLGLLRRYAPTWLTQLPAFNDAMLNPPGSNTGKAVSAQRMLREMADALEAAAAERPMLLVFEDMHWSDTSTVDLLSLLAQRREPARLLIIATCRPVELIVNAHPLKQIKHELIARGQAGEILLGRLSRADVRAYMATCRPGHTTTSAVADAVYRRSQGHPLFMAQLANDLPDSAGEFQIDDAALPTGIAELIDAQLSRLAPEALAILEAACVAGVEFVTAEVAAALEMPSSSVEARLEALAQAGQFIEPCGVIEWHDGTVSGAYRFGHDLYREVLYRRLGASRRVHFHDLIGSRLEAAYGARADEIAAKLALHAECARKWWHAAVCRRSAAQNAGWRYAPKEALAHASRGRALLSQSGTDDEALELELLLIEGASLQHVHGYASPDVEAIFTRALALGTRLGNLEAIGPALSGLYNFYLTRADFDSVARVARQVLEFIEQKPEPALEMLVNNVIGTAKLYTDDAAGSLQYAERTLALYDPQTHHVLAAKYGEDPGIAAYHYAVLARWITGDAALAAEDLALGYALAEQLGHPYSEAQMLWVEAVIRLDEEEFDQVEQITQQLTSLCVEHDFALWLSGGQILRGAALAGLGRVEEGRAVTRAGLESWRALGIELFLPHALSVAARVDAVSGRAGDALHLLEEALAIASRTGERWYEAELHRRRGQLLRSRSSVTDSGAALAASCFKQAVHVAQRQGASLFVARARASGTA